MFEGEHLFWGWEGGNRCSWLLPKHPTIQCEIWDIFILYKFLGGKIDKPTTTRCRYVWTSLLLHFTARYYKGQQNSEYMTEVRMI